MTTKMAANFLESGCIHQISNHNMIFLGFWTQNNYIRSDEIQKKRFHVILSWLNIKNILRGLNTTQHLTNFDENMKLYNCYIHYHSLMI